MGLTLIDSRNGFNGISCLEMLWTVRNHWPSGSRFALNCYRHESQLIVQRPAAICHILTSREELAQGYPISVVLYGLGLLILADAMWEADLEVLQPWYADDEATWETNRRNTNILCAFTEKVPFHGYFPEPEKIWHICAEEREEEEARESFDAEGLKVRFKRGQRYLDGLCGERWTGGDAGVVTA